MLIDERQEKVSPELQAVIESEIKRLINVSIFPLFVFVSVDIVLVVFDDVAFNYILNLKL